MESKRGKFLFKLFSFIDTAGYLFLITLKAQFDDFGVTRSLEEAEEGMVGSESEW